MTYPKIFLAVSMSLGLAGSAIARATHEHGAMSDRGRGSTKPGAKDDAATEDFKAADMAMIRDMDVAYTGNPDVDFRTHMIPHHMGAVAMAKVALMHARDASTRAMARRIIDDQEKEIDEMAAWLKTNAK